MRILHFVPSFSPLSETFIYDYVTELERHGVDNHVITLRRLNEKDRPFPKVQVVGRPSRWHPRRLWHRALVPFGIGEARTTDWPQTRDRLEGITRSVAPDAIHAHFGPAGVLIAPVAHGLNIPMILTLYGYDVSKLAREEFWRRKYPSTFEAASLLLGISNHICSRVEDLGGSPQKIKCWHLGVDLSHFDYRPADKSFDGQTVQCLHIGRLVEKKSPIDLVRSFHYALGNVGGDLDLHLKVAGDGPLRKSLRQEVKSLGIEEQVSLLGTVPHTRIPTLLNEANIYTQHCKTASDGDQEGQGVTFVEASASGLPIVTTRHNGIPDVVIDGKTGCLVDEGDVEGMGKAIASLASDSARWVSLGRAGRQHIEDSFDLHNQTHKMIDDNYPLIT
jgi:colanic acid/amylovoran biosynthesis glycosyltransferase